MKTVLVVDNTPDAQNCIVKTLGRCGYRVISVQTGAAALAVLRSEDMVDLVISEYMIPDMDGIAFVSSVKTFFPGLPVIMVTACCSIETYIKTLSVGVFEYLNKPILDHELARIVKAATEGPPLADVANF
jgi:DNA-binding NtrC family response regulator